MRWVLLALLLGGVFAATCGLTSEDADAIHTSYYLNSDKSVFFWVQTWIPSSEECLRQQNFEVLLERPIDCGTEQFADYVYNAFGEKFMEESYCSISFQDEHILINVSGLVPDVIEVDEGEYSFNLFRWTAESAEEGTEDTLRIVLPTDITEYNYYPKKGSVVVNNSIFWRELPLEKPVITFKPKDGTPLYMCGIAGFIVIAVIGIGAVYWFRVKKKEVLKDVVIKRGTSVLIEGPLASKKTKYAHKILRDYLARNEKASLVTFHPARDASHLGNNPNVSAVKAYEDLNELNTVCIDVSREQPAAVLFSVLYRLIPLHPLDKIDSFISRTLDRFRPNTTVIFIFESEGFDRSIVSTIEPMFDTVIEFKVKEEKGQLVSYYIVKRFEGLAVSEPLRRFD
jgi:hypothetical protein